MPADLAAAYCGRMEAWFLGRVRSLDEAFGVKGLDKTFGVEKEEP